MLVNVLRQLPFLVEVSRSGSFTCAAENMHLSQAAISYRIRELEDTLGCKVVSRSRGGETRLTSVGQTLVDEYVFIEKRLRLVLHNLDHDSGRGRLNITVPVDFGSIVMPKVIAYLKVHAPLLEIRVHISDELVDLKTSDFDMAIRHKGRTNSNPVFTSKLVLIGSESYLKRAGLPTSIKSLESHSLLSRNESSQNAWAKLFSQCSKTVYEDIEDKTFLSTTMARKNAALEGVGLAFLPYFMVEKEINSNDLHIIDLDEYEDTNAYFYIEKLDAPQLDSFEKIMSDAVNAVS